MAITSIITALLVPFLFAILTSPCRARLVSPFDRKFHNNLPHIDLPIEEPPPRLFSGSPDPFSDLNFRPLIGILSQPGDGDGGIIIKRKGWTSANVSYIAASYVKFVEMGGARAVPLIHNEPENILLRKLGAINGILFPGGGASLKDGPFYRTAEKLFQMALEENDKGDYFPVFGTCLGFELLNVIISKDHDILERFSAKAQPTPLFFINDQAKQRSMFRWFPSKIIEKLSTESLAMQNHQFGISPQRMAANGRLSSFFRVLTTSPDKNNEIYVSSVEGRKYPVTGVQWHPEKNAFEWGISNIPHSAEAIEVTQSVANFLVSEARKSHHRPSREDEEEFLIYNYSPFYTGKDGSGHFDQSYVFVNGTSSGYYSTILQKL